MAGSATVRVGGVALMATGLAGLTWLALELVPPFSGYEDTDSPAVSLEYLQAHPQVYAFAGITLIVLAVALTLGAFSLADRLTAAAVPSLAVRATSAAGLLAATLLFCHGVLRMAAEPLLYVNGLDPAWGEAGYVTLQFVGIHLLAQGGLLALCLWVIAVSVLSLRTRSLPVALCLLGFVPGIRVLLLLLAPVAGDGPDILWVISMLVVPLTLLWCVLAGAAVLRRPPVTSPQAIAS